MNLLGLLGPKREGTRSVFALEFLGRFLTPYKLIPLAPCPYELILLIMELDDSITDSPCAFAVRCKGPLSKKLSEKSAF